MSNNKIQAYWWSPQRLGVGDFQNFGDEVGPFLISRITNKEVVWKNVKKKSLLSRFGSRVLLSVGSIISHGNSNCDIWGSGIISETDAVPLAKYFAVRGPYSGKYIKAKTNIDCTVYGDPALLLPSFLKPAEKKCEVGIIPHTIHYETVQSFFNEVPHVKVIDLTRQLTEVVSDITSCHRTLSSSLHGLIVSHAYDIPSLQINLAPELHGDGIKFKDYFASVGIDDYEGHSIGKIEEIERLVSNDELFEKYMPTTDMDVLRGRLLNSFPSSYLNK